VSEVRQTDVAARWQYGEFIACSGYPKCKYVKQELWRCRVRSAARRCGKEDEAGRYVLRMRELSQVRFLEQPEDDQRGVPKCDSAYLLELSNAKGVFLVWPEQPRSAAKRRPRKGAKVEEPKTPECGFQKKIGLRRQQRFRC